MATLLALSIVILISTTAANYRLDSTEANEPLGGDFLQDWIGGYIVSSGNVDRLYDSQWTESLQHEREIIGFEWSSTGYFPMIYPPAWYVAVSPLSRIPYATACTVWLAILATSLPVIAYICHGLLRLPAATVLAFCVGVVFYPPVLQSLVMGQKSLIWLTIWIATFALLHRKRDLWAGVLFGLMLAKPIMVPVMIGMMIAHGRWRFVVASGCSALAIGLASLSVVPVEVWHQYIQVAAGAGTYHQSGGYDHQLAQNIGAMLLPIAGDYRNVYWTLFLALGIVVVILMTRLVKADRCDNTYASESRFWLATIVGTVLLSPHFFAYDLAVLAMLPVIFHIHGDMKQAFPWIATGFLLTTVGPRITEATDVAFMPLFLIGLLVVFASRPLPTLAGGLPQS